MEWSRSATGSKTALHVVESEAEFVRALYRRYLELGSVVRLKAALDTESVRSPSRMRVAGRPAAY